MWKNSFNAAPPFSLASTLMSALSLMLLLLTPRCSTTEPGNGAINMLFSELRADPRVRPVKHRNETVVVTVSLVLQRISSLDETHQQLETTFTYEFQWKVRYLIVMEMYPESNIAACLFDDPCSNPFWYHCFLSGFLSSLLRNSPFFDSEPLPISFLHDPPSSPPPPFSLNRTRF